MKVGSKVKLLGSRSAFENAFRGKYYVWNNAMENLLGKTVTVVSRTNGDTFGLPKSDPNSPYSVWLYPLSVITSVECVDTTTPPPTTTTISCKCSLLCGFCDMCTNANGQIDPNPKAKPLTASAKRSPGVLTNVVWQVLVTAYVHPMIQCRPARKSSCLAHELTSKTRSGANLTCGTLR